MKILGLRSTSIIEHQIGAVNFPKVDGIPVVVDSPHLDTGPYGILTRRLRLKHVNVNRRLPVRWATEVELKAWHGASQHGERWRQLKAVSSLVWEVLSGTDSSVTARE